MRYVPMSGPDLTEAEYAAVRDVLASGQLSIGPRIAEFEASFSRCLGVPHAAGVSSGTAGLHLCVVAAGLGERHAVITSPFSFVASANCLLYERAIPLFVDVDPVTGNLNPSLVAEAAEDVVGRKSSWKGWLAPALGTDGTDSFTLKVLLPVHAFGQPADMDPIVETARRHDLIVIEDACEAIGAEYKHHKVGTFGDAATFAFYPNKQMTTGEGGMIVTRHAEWDSLFRSLRNQGRDVFDEWLNHSRLGYNYRLDELSAALGVVQLARLDELLAKRERVAGWYNTRLEGVEGLSIPYIAPTTTRMSWFVYVVRLHDQIDRTLVMHALAEAGIPSRPYFSPIHLQPFYVERFGYRPGAFPNTERLARQSLALPFSGVMTEDQVDYVCEQLKGVVKSSAR